MSVLLGIGTAPNLQRGEHYTVTIMAGEDEKNPHNITVQFTAQGLVRLQEARGADAGAKVFTKITAKAPDRTHEQGTADIVNKAMTITNNGSGQGEAIRDSNPVESRWGTLNLKKTGGDSDVGLRGAKFQLVECTEQADNKCVAASGPLTVNGRDHWITDDQGRIKITGIHASDFANGARKPAETMVSSSTACRSSKLLQASSSWIPCCHSS